MTGELVYFEIPTADGERARTFYGELFGWHFEESSDIDGGIERVRELGGDADDPQEIPSGYYAHCHDDQGTPFALWQSKQDNP